MSKLKVYGDSSGTHRRIVAAHNKKEAAEKLRVSLYHFNLFCCDTGNAEEIELALSKPGAVFEQSHRTGGQPWKERTT